MADIICIIERDVSGDFAPVDAEELRKEIIGAMSEAVLVSAAPHQIIVGVPDGTDDAVIRAIIKAHGTAEAVSIRARKAVIQAELADLDRTVSREGEEYLAGLEAIGAAGPVWAERKAARDRKVLLRAEYRGL